MTSPLIYSATALLLFAMALVATISRTLLLQRLIALNVMGSSAFLFLVATAYRTRDPFPDPVPHAMVLTGIVVAVALTAFAVGLIRRVGSGPGGDEEDER